MTTGALAPASADPRVKRSATSASTARRDLRTDAARISSWLASVRCGASTFTVVRLTSPLLEHRHECGEAPDRARGRDAVVGRLLGQPEDLPAVLVERSESRREVERSSVQLRQVHDEQGGGLPLARGQRRHGRRQLVVAQLRQLRWSDHRHERLIAFASDRSGHFELRVAEDGWTYRSSEYCPGLRPRADKYPANSSQDDVGSNSFQNELRDALDARRLVPLDDDQRAVVGGLAAGGEGVHRAQDRVVQAGARPSRGWRTRPRAAAPRANSSSSGLQVSVTPSEKTSSASPGPITASPSW